MSVKLYRAPYLSRSAAAQPPLSMLWAAMLTYVEVDLGGNRCQLKRQNRCRFNRIISIGAESVLLYFTVVGF